jgi:hypothetical protein
MLEAMDYQFVGNSVREERPEFDLLPSEYFARNVYACVVRTGGVAASNRQNRAGQRDV